VGIRDMIVSQMKVSRDGIAPRRSKNWEYISLASVSMDSVRRWQRAAGAAYECVEHGGICKGEVPELENA
jgi:hypothetical protein